MRINSITLNNFRSHIESRFDFGRNVTVISGPNGSGKTSILEAIYILMRGKSFRDNDSSLTQFNKDFWRVTGSFNKAELDSEASEEAANNRDVRYIASKVNNNQDTRNSLEQSQKSSKQFLLNNTKKSRLTSKYTLPVVLFEPDDLLLIHGSPSRRRKHIDQLISQLYPVYSSIVNRYQRALQQRNSLLKNNDHTISIHNYGDTLFVWDITLADLASKIISRRCDVLKKLSSLVNKYYQEISKNHESVELIYSPATHYNFDNLQQNITSLLLSRQQRDKMTGFTSVGPHRDDITYLLKGRDSSITASRGEIRTIILALKLAETQLIEQDLSEKPIILLDDVFSELDLNHRDSLVNNLSHDEQIIITTTNSDVHSFEAGEFGHIKL
jgi:DNA replication and repair protein RecF